MKAVLRREPRKIWHFNNAGEQIFERPSGVTGDLSGVTGDLSGVTGNLGGVWGAFARVGAVVPRFVRDALYDLVARHRQRLAGAGTSCLMPTADERTRFLDR